MKPSWRNFKGDLNKKWGNRPYSTGGPHPVRVRHGCTCQKMTTEEDGTVTHTYDKGVDSECGYHRYAARHPDDHRSPWNCPTYYDGCNCPDWERMTRNVIAGQRKRRSKGDIRPDKGIRRVPNPYY